MPVTKIRVSAPAPYENPTIIENGGGFLKADSSKIMQWPFLFYFRIFNGIWGGQNVRRTLRGLGACPESCPWKAWTFDPQIEGFCRISVEKGKFQGPLEIQNFSPCSEVLPRGPRKFV